MKKLFSIFVAALLPLLAFGQGKISTDPTASALAGSEYIAGVQSAANVKILPSQLLTYTRANLAAVNAQSGTTYTYLASDVFKLVTHSNASAIAGTLPQATGSFTTGWFVTVYNTGAGTLTITPTTSTINGASTLALLTGQFANIWSDGTNYKATTVSTGGGGLTNFTEAVNTSAPNSTVPVVSLTATNAASNVDIAIKPKGTGAITRLIADNGTTNGNKRGANAVDFQGDLNVDATAIAAGTGSFIGNGLGNKINSAGSQAVITGGYLNSVGGSASQAAIGGGRQNSVTSNYGTISGGTVNTASTGNYPTVGGGNSNTASNTGATVPGGENNIADGVDSTAMGIWATTRTMTGSLAYSSTSAFSIGKRQMRLAVLSISSTDAATTKVLTSNTSTASGTNQFNLVTGSSLRLKGVVSFRNSSTGDSGSFDVSGQCKNVSGTVTLSGTPVISAYMGDSSLNTVAVAVVADNTNKACQVTVNGVAATNIDYSALFESIESTN